MDEKLRLLAISGSLRKGSFNTALLRAAQELAPASMSIDIHDLSGVPLYNQDLEDEPEIEAVAAFRKALWASDGLLIATPEHNYNVSAASKNAIDWASRPYGEAALTGRPTAVMGASPGMGGTIRAQAALRLSFVLNAVPCMPSPEVYVSFAKQKFDEGLRLRDEPTREHLAKFLSAFEAWVRKTRLQTA